MDGKNGSHKEREKDKKTVIKGVRMTKEEAAILRREAEQEHISEGAWIRIRLFNTDHAYIPFEIRSAFNRCVYELGKAGVNINAIARDCQLHKSVDAYDMRRLQSCVDELKRILTETYECVKGVVAGGSDKTAPD